MIKCCSLLVFLFHVVRAVPDFTTTVPQQVDDILTKNWTIDGILGVLGFFISLLDLVFSIFQYWYQQKKDKQKEDKEKWDETLLISHKIVITRDLSEDERKEKLISLQTIDYNLNEIYINMHGISNKYIREAIITALRGFKTFTMTIAMMC